MNLRLLASPNYQGEAGVLAMRGLQRELTSALLADDWDKVRRLDSVCVLLIDKVIAANRDDKTTLVMALSELKGVYAGMIAQCQREVAAMAN